MKKIYYLFLLIAMVIVQSCKTTSALADDSSSEDKGEKSIVTSLPPKITAAKATLPAMNSRPVSAIPKATAFRMNGDYADKVAVSVDAQGNLTYFPAPSDITSLSAPLKLAEGWWLNRQGISINSVFTKYTFSEYAALPAVPTISELKAAIIPGARVTEIITLPYTIGEASANIPAINEFLLTTEK